MKTQPPIIEIKFVPAGVELVLAALNKLPRESVDGLYQEINGQYQYQLHALQNTLEKSGPDDSSNEDKSNQDEEGKTE